MADTPKQPDPFDTSHLVSDLKGRSIRGGAVTVAAQGARFAIRMGSTIVLARLLTPGDFGLIAMVTALTGFAMMFRDLGLSMATIQREKITHAQVSNLFWVNAIVGLVVAAVVALSAPLVSWFYTDPRLTDIARVLSIAFVFGGLGVQHQALLRRQMRFTALGVVAIVGMAAGVAAAIVAALLGAGYWSLVVMTLTTEAVTTLATWIVQPWRPGLPSRRSDTKSLLHFGKHITGFNIVNYFARNLDNILIGRVIGAAALGLYAKAYGLMLLPVRQINAPLSAVSLPALSRLNDDPQRYRQYYTKVVAFMACVIMPFAAFVAVMSDAVVQSVLGEQWSRSAPLLSLFALSIFIDPIANPVGWLFVSQGRTRECFNWGIFATCLTAASIVIGLNWGVVGVAASYSIMAVFFRTPVQLWYVGRYGPVSGKDILAATWPAAASAVVLVVALYVFKASFHAHNHLTGLIIGLLAAAAVSLLLLYKGRGHRAFKHLFPLRVS